MGFHVLRRVPRYVPQVDLLVLAAHGAFGGADARAFGSEDAGLVLNVVWVLTFRACSEGRAGQARPWMRLSRPLAT